MSAPKADALPLGDAPISCGNTCSSQARVFICQKNINASIFLSNVEKKYNKKNIFNFIKYNQPISLLNKC